MYTVLTISWAVPPPPRRVQYSMHETYVDAIRDIATFLGEPRIDFHVLEEALMQGGVACRKKAADLFVVHVPKEADTVQTLLDFALRVANDDISTMISDDLVNVDV